MRETKRQWEHFDFYDKTAIEEKLEAMAAQGWLIEQPRNHFWRYRRIEPKQLHISVTYFPNASEFDPAPTEGQQQLEDFCAKDGWILAARWGQMQIFYNEQENPVPIETDPVTQVETIHRAMKKTWLFPHLLLIGLCVYQMVFTGWKFLYDPVDFLASAFEVYATPMWLLLSLALMMEMSWYFRWYQKARDAAENGVFLELKNNHAIAYLLIGISIVMLALALGSTTLTRWIVVIMILLLIVPAITTRAMNRWMKKRGFSRVANRTVTLSVTFIFTMALAALLSTIIIHSGISISGREPVGTYNINGWEMDVYADEMPLYVQDLTETTCSDWSTSARKDETFFVSHIEYYQRPLTQDRSVPDLSYTVTQVKAPFLSDYCKNSLVNSRQDEVRDGEVLLEDHYDAIDATPWQAQEAYRVYWGDGYLNKYLLCYEDTFVEIHFDWEPTTEQMQIVAEKLNEK